MKNRVLLLIGILLCLLSFIAIRETMSAQGIMLKPPIPSPCRPSALEQPIPDDGRWLQVCLLDPMAPEGTMVSAVHVKFLIEHPDPDQLEIRLVITYPLSLRGGNSRRSNPPTGLEIASPPSAARNDAGG